MLYAMGGGSNDIRKKTLMFLVSIGEKPADRIDLLVVMLEMGPDDLTRTALVLGITHVGMDFVIIRMDSDSPINISIKEHFQ